MLSDKALGVVNSGSVCECVRAIPSCRHKRLSNLDQHPYCQVVLLVDIPMVLSVRLAQSFIILCVNCTTQQCYGADRYLRQVIRTAVCALDLALQALWVEMGPGRSGNNSGNNGH